MNKILIYGFTDPQRIYFIYGLLKGVPTYTIKW